MPIRLPETGSPGARQAAAIGLPAVLLGAVVFGLVAGAQPLYEAEAVLSGDAPALLEQYDRAAGGSLAVNRGENTLDRAYVGDPEELAPSARKRLGFRGSSDAVRMEVDGGASEIRIIARDKGRVASRRLANEVATGIVAVREELVRTSLTNARAKLPLVTTFAPGSPTLRREAAVLRDRIAALRQLRTVQGGGLTVLRLAATPSEPVAPRVARDVIVAVLLGLLVGVSLREVKRRSPFRLRLRRPAGRMTPVRAIGAILRGRTRRSA